MPPVLSMLRDLSLTAACRTRFAMSESLWGFTAASVNGSGNQREVPVGGVLELSVCGERPQGGINGRTGARVPRRL